jgi:hypothetical protein
MNLELISASVTKRVTAHTMQHRGRVIHLIDTPGFGDTYRSDEDVFLESAYTLIKAYEFGIRISAIVYVQPMVNVRLTGSTKHNLKMLRELCGVDAYPCVWLAANRCDDVSSDQLEQNLEELKSEPSFWRELYEGGATIFELDDQPNSALALLDDILDVDSTYILQFQRQVLDEGRKIHDTSVGRVMFSEISRTVDGLKLDLVDLRHELEEARQQNQQSATDDLQKSIQDTKRNLDEQIKRTHALSNTAEELKTQWDAIYAEERRQTTNRFQELNRKINELNQTTKEEQACPPPYKESSGCSLQLLHRERAEVDSVLSMQLAQKNLKVAKGSLHAGWVGALVGLGSFAITAAPIAAVACSVM